MKTTALRPVGERDEVGWREQSGPATAEPRHRGFGLSMIQAIATRQLGGRIGLDWRPEGLAAELTVPLRKARRLQATMT